MRQDALQRAAPVHLLHALGGLRVPVRQRSGVRRCKAAGWPRGPTHRPTPYRQAQVPKRTNTDSRIATPIFAYGVQLLQVHSLAAAAALVMLTAHEGRTLVY